MPRLRTHRPAARRRRAAWDASKELARACVAWGYGAGPAAPYLEAHAAWRRARALPWGELLEIDRTARDWMIGDALFTGAHGLNVTSILRPDLRLQRQERARLRCRLPLGRAA